VAWSRSGLRVGPTLALVLALASAAPVVYAGPGKDPREQTARAFFAVGKYREAIDVFAQMYAEKPHANYIFNIGRCYQNLPDPDKAIASFRDYLRRAPKLSAAEKQEIDGYIREMEDLKKQRGAAATALADLVPKEEPAKAPAVAAPSAPVAPATPTPTPAAATPASAAPAEAPAATKAAAAPDPATAQLAAWRGRAEALWQEQAAKADDARLAKIEAMLERAKADDPRLAEYQLYLGSLYAAKHFKSRLKANGARKLDDGEAAAGDAAPDLKAVDAEANGAFLKAVSAYAAASKVKDFPRADEALYQLALILQANNMEARATSVLSRLVRTMPDSKFGKQVAAGGAPKTP
jgi:tetratricopeptide (TPR) repeat protein